MKLVNNTMKIDEQIKYWASLVTENIDEEQNNRELTLSEFIQILDDHKILPFMAKSEEKTSPVSNKVEIEGNIIKLNVGGEEIFTGEQIVDSILQVVDADGVDGFVVKFYDDGTEDSHILDFVEGDEAFYVELGSGQMINEYEWARRGRGWVNDEGYYSRRRPNRSLYVELGDGSYIDAYGEYHAATPASKSASNQSMGKTLDGDKKQI